MAEPTRPVQDDLCGAYRQLMTDKIGVVSSRVTTTEDSLKELKGTSVLWYDKLELRVRDLERHKSEHDGITKNQAMWWGIVLIVVAALINIGIEKWFGV